MGEVDWKVGGGEWNVGGDGWKISGGKRLKEVDAVFSIINIIRTKPYKTVFTSLQLKYKKH